MTYKKCPQYCCSMCVISIASLDVIVKSDESTLDVVIAVVFLPFFELSFDVFAAVRAQTFAAVIAAPGAQAGQDEAFDVKVVAHLILDGLDPNLGFWVAAVIVLCVKACDQTRDLTVEFVQTVDPKVRFFEWTERHFVAEPV